MPQYKLIYRSIIINFTLIFMITHLTEANPISIFDQLQEKVEQNRDKRSFYDIHCKGIYDKSVFARVDQICEDCYNLFREPKLHSFCRFDISSTSAVSEKQYICEGRRIVDLNSFLNQICELRDHDPGTSCSFSNMTIIGEHKKGLPSNLIFKCEMCSLTTEVDAKFFFSEMDINTYAAAGSICTGGSTYNNTLETILGTMKVPCMSSRTYLKVNTVICKMWETVETSEMQKSAKEEAEIAKRKGDLEENGISLNTVVADGSWGKDLIEANTVLSEALRSCFTTEYFKGCVEVLLLTDEFDKIQEWIRRLNGLGV